jgi:catechol 2,3-dioxygenase-like lactoylglutathione lyase family enzyme
VTFSGAHVILYSRDAAADRAFVRDVLGFAGVDAGDGWLIFTLPPAEIALHPTDGDPAVEFYLMCDDIEALRARLATLGVEMAPVSDQGWGLLASIRLPSGADLAIYEPRHPTAFDLGD